MIPISDDTSQRRATPWVNYALIFIGFFFTFTRLSAVLLIGFWFVTQFIPAITSLGKQATNGGVAVWAHVGAFAAGLLLVKLFQRRRAVPPYALRRAGTAA